MSDLIDREQAIAIINRFKSPDDTMAKFEVVDLLKDIPPAEKTGRWVEEKNRHLHWHCSNCGYAISLIKMDGHYCPNCGAKMEG